MKAEPAIQRRLLDLQALDAALDRLATRRRTLPALAELDKLNARLGGLTDDVVRGETEVNDIARAQKRLEDEVELVRGRADRDRGKLDSGRISSAKELENLSSEIASLARRQNALEDDLLEIMQSREEVEARVAALRRELAGVVAERDLAAARRDEAFAEIDTDAAIRRAERDALGPTLPTDLITLYDRIRSAPSAAGVGAAALVRRRCEGCHLELSGGDLRAVAAAPVDEVMRCEECRRILVRTPESGL